MKTPPFIFNRLSVALLALFVFSVQAHAEFHSSKKGVGAGEEKHITALNVSWYYNWNIQRVGGVDPAIEYVPMKHNEYWRNEKELANIGEFKHYLGFNEPERSDQGDITVAKAISQWPNITSKVEQHGLPGALMGSPVTANPGHQWIIDFMNQADAQNLRVDFMAMHKYPTPTSSGNILNGAAWYHNTYGKDVWITEFNAADWNGENDYTQADCYGWMAEVLFRLESTEYIKRYAIFPWRGNTSQSEASPIFEMDAQGNKTDTLTPLGRLYAEYRSVDINGPYIQTWYHVHNKGSKMHLSSSGGASSMSTIHAEGNLVEFELINAGGGNYFIARKNTGERLTSDGITTTWTAGANGSSAKWFLETTDYNWVKLKHAASGNYLYGRDNGEVGVSASSSGDIDQWVFVRTPSDYTGSTNQAPVFNGDPLVGQPASENQAYGGTLADHASDADGDPMSFSKVNGPAWLSVASNGVLSGTPGASDIGVNNFTVLVQDNNGNSSSTTFNVMVLSTTGTLPTAFVHWSFDDESGNTASDSSGNGRDGAIVGGTWVEGYVGGALSLDGVDDKVTHLLSESTWPAYTVCMWVKASELGQIDFTGVFNNNSSGSDFQIDTDGLSPGSLRYTRSGEKNAVLFAPVSTDWAHIAISFDGTTVSLYQDGVLTGTSNEAGNAFGQLQVGANRGNSKFFAGVVDEVRVYDVALDAVQINQVLAYDPGAGGGNTAPVIDATPTSSADPVILPATTDLSVGASDVDGDELSYSWSMASGPGTVNFTTNNSPTSATTTASFDLAGSYVLQVVVTDGNGGTVTDGVAVEVQQLNNQPPVWDSPPTSFTATQGVAFQKYISWRVSDPDGDSIYWNKVSGPAWINVNLTSGELTGTPGQADVGTTPITITITDNNHVPVAHTFDLIVEGVNSAPEVNIVADPTATLNGDASWTPAEIAALAWYDASDASTIAESGGFVSQWADKSGNGHDLTQPAVAEQPQTGVATLNGLNVLAFDGVDDDISNASIDLGAGSPGMQVIAVMIPEAHTSNDEYFGYSTSITAGKVFAASAASNSANDYTGRFWNGFSASNVIQSAGTAFLSSMSKPLDGTHADAAIHLNGAAAIPSLNKPGNGWAFEASGSELCLANVRSDKTNHCQMKCAEFIMVDRVLTDDERQKLEGYLAHKWGLAGELPAGHPYKDAAPGQAAAEAGLDGAVTDADPDDTVSTTWSMVSGPAPVIFADATAVDTTVTFTMAGTYVLRLTAFDGTATTFSEVTITVNEPVINTAPTASGGTATTDQDVPVLIPLTASDPEDDQLSYIVVSGPSHGALSGSGDSRTYTPNSGYSGDDSFTFKANDGSLDSEVVTIDITVNPVIPQVNLVRTTISGVSSTGWTTVGLGQSYTSPVIVATPIHPEGQTTPVVTRITNITASGFDVKLDRVDDLTDPVSLDVSIIVVEEGVYTQAEHGVTMEAVTFNSAITSSKTAWAGELRTLQNAYTNPVVVGQVMSANDPNWSVFWSMGASRTAPADATNLSVGKHVGEDPNNTRANETIGYIVIEAGNGTISGVAYEAGTGADSVKGFGDSVAPYSYTLSGSLSSASAAAISQAAMDGKDGSWAVLSGADPLTSTSISLHLNEDMLADSEHKHTSEQVSYLVFE